MIRRVQLAAIAIALLVLGLYLNRLPPFTHSVEQTSGFSVPTQVGPWSVTSEGRLDSRSLGILEPDLYALRRYDAPGRTSIHTFIAFYSGRAGTSKGAHHPEICYPAGGWDMVGSEAVEISASESDSFHALLLDMKRGAAAELVLYWFQPAERWPSSQTVEQLLFLVDAIAGRPQYAFVRLVVPIATDSDRQRAAADLEDFAEKLAWPVRTALSATENYTSSLPRSPGRTWGLIAHE